VSWAPAHPYFTRCSTILGRSGASAVTAHAAVNSVVPMSGPPGRTHSWWPSPLSAKRSRLMEPTTRAAQDGMAWPLSRAQRGESLPRQAAGL